MASIELELLLRALEERNVELGPDDVAWAFESAATKGDVKTWVREYLHEPSLLTVEEKAL